MTNQSPLEFFRWIYPALVPALFLGVWIGYGLAALVQTLAEQRARRRHREQWERDHLDLAPMRQTRCDVCEGERGWEKAETIPNEAGGSVYAIRWEHCPACAGSGQRTIRL